MLQDFGYPPGAVTQVGMTALEMKVADLNLKMSVQRAVEMLPLQSVQLAVQMILREVGQREAGMWICEVQLEA